jgi:hypothetical protein
MCIRLEPGMGGWQAGRLAWDVLDFVTGQPLEVHRVLQQARHSFANVCVHLTVHAFLRPVRWYYANIQHAGSRSTRLSTSSFAPLCVILVMPDFFIFLVYFGCPLGMCVCVWHGSWTMLSKQGVSLSLWATLPLMCMMVLDLPSD